MRSRRKYCSTPTCASAREPRCQTAPGQCEAALPELRSTLAAATAGVADSHDKTSPKQTQSMAKRAAFLVHVARFGNGKFIQTLCPLKLAIMAQPCTTTGIDLDHDMQARSGVR